MRAMLTRRSAATNTSRNLHKTLARLRPPQIRPMSPDHAIDVVREALLTAALLASPLLLVLFATGFVTSLLQNFTGWQDPTLALLPRLAAGALAALWLLPWILSRLTEYSTDLFRATGGGL